MNAPECVTDPGRNRAVHKAWITGSGEFVVSCGVVHNAFRIGLISHAAVSIDMRPIRHYATHDKVLNPCTRSLPRFPDTHSYSPAEQLVYCLKLLLHIRQLEVVDPAQHRLMQYLFAPLVSHSVASACQQFQFCFQLGDAHGMRPQPSAFSWGRRTGRARRRRDAPATFSLLLSYRMSCRGISSPAHSPLPSSLGSPSREVSSQ